MFHRVYLQMHKLFTLPLWCDLDDILQVSSGPDHGSNCGFHQQPSSQHSVDAEVRNPARRIPLRSFYDATRQEDDKHVSNQTLSLLAFGCQTHTDRGILPVLMPNNLTLNRAVNEEDDRQTCAGHEACCLHIIGVHDETTATTRCTINGGIADGAAEFR